MAMNDKGDKAQSTDFVPFDRANKSGIAPSMPAGSQTAMTKGNTAKFTSGKKSVSK
jgi:hypothetical protein